MLGFEQVKSKRGLLKCLTGLSLEGFEALLLAFAAAYGADVRQRDARRTKARVRAHGAGQKGALPELADKLLFILVYFRVYPVQTVQGFLFGMGQPQANAWVHRLSPVLRAALGSELQLPQRSPRDIKAVLKTCPGLAFIIDGTERPIRRPKDSQRQEATYSGKKKRNTVKNSVLSDKRTGKIKALGPTVEGKRHDKKLADDQRWRFPKGSTLWKDTGFQGYEPNGVNTLQPTKKPKGRELSAQQKAVNATISSVRIGIEHTLGGVKVFRIVADVYRNLRSGFDDLVMDITCGLHNFRLDHPLTV
jgi:hypothetical protein